MKKILFNGCSFMSGDEIAWAKYSEEIGNSLSWQWFCSTQTKTIEQDKLWSDYHVSYKRNNNLPHFVINLLGLDVDSKIDLSSEGKSNDMITVSTISYLLHESPKDRLNYHVVVGWTTNARLMRYSSKYSNFVDLTVQHLDFPVAGSEGFKDFIKIALANAESEDLAINYFKNVILLENFLLANNISYTFYRAIGDESDCKMRHHKFYSGGYNTGILQTEKLSNDSNWIRFDSKEISPIIGNSWAHSVLGGFRRNLQNYVSSTNGHPNTNSAKRFAVILANKILQQVSIT